jgi:transposase
MYKTGEYSQRKLATEFNVSRRTIQFIIDPAKREQNYQKRVERGGSKQYYDKDKNNAYMKKHREHKKKLFDNGDLI